LSRPPPRWLWDAIHELCERCRSDDEKRAYRDGVKHFRRWRAVELVRGRRPGDPDNYKKKVRGDDVWAEAAKLLAGTDAEGSSAETVKKSHALIRRAGGALASLPNYRREVQARGRRRKEKNLR
jgi:hypothetical protein